MVSVSPAEFSSCKKKTFITNAFFLAEERTEGGAEHGLAYEAAHLHGRTICFNLNE